MSKKINFFKNRGAGVDNVFRLEIVVADSETINLPLESGGTYSFTVNYGEGGDKTVNAWDDANASYTFTTGGTYELTIDGTCTLFEVDNDASIDTNIYKVKNWGSIGLTSLNFNGCSNLTTITATDFLDSSSMTSFLNLFFNCTSLSNITGVDSWDTSTITNMQSVFQNCDAFNQSIDSWDVSNVTNFLNIFALCLIYNQPVPSWTTTAATSMSGMFNGAKAWNQSVDHFDVDQVTTFSNMFRDTDDYNQSMNSWTLKSTGTINMSNMFFNAKVFNGNIISWNTTRVNFMNNMFTNADAFNIDIGSWNVSTCTSFISMFQNTAIFNRSLDSWDVGAGTTFQNMFAGAISFNSALNSWTFRTSGSVNLLLMFSGATVFNQPLNGWTMTEVTTIGGLFLNAVAFNQNLPDWDVAKCSVMNQVFWGATVFNGTLTNWTTTALTRTDLMFQNAVAFNQPVPFDVSNVTNFQRMFDGATIFNQDISAFDITSATNMTEFGENSNFSTANWDLMISAWEGLASTPSTITIIMNASYTQTSVDSGTTDGGATNKLIDVGQNFVTTVTVNDIVHNTTDDTYAKITAIDDNENLSLDNDIMVSGETYVIQSSQVAKDRYSLLDTYSWTIVDGGAV